MLISVEEALEKVLSSVPELRPERVSLRDCDGRVLAEDLMAREGYPPFDNSAMEGFAVRAGDLSEAGPERPVRLLVKGLSRAGQAGTPEIHGGEALRIMTGAPIPAGADAVIMQELVLREGDGWVEFGHAPRRGDNIRPRWEDVEPGEPLLPRGRALRPYEVALLAAQGIAEVPVVRRPAAAILSTGDELADPGQAELRPGQIRDSNGPAVAAALRRWGAAVIVLGSLPDDPARIGEALARAREADLVVVSGGVSVGDFDLTPGVLAGLGFETVFWRVAMKPGKPLLFGLLPGPSGKVPVFGLPGNPVSALVCLEEFVRPAVEKMQGKAASHPSWHLAGTVRNGYRLHDGSRHFLFCRAWAANGAFLLEILKPQGSARVAMACRANALALSPRGARSISPGDVMEFRWLK